MRIYGLLERRWAAPVESRGEQARGQRVGRGRRAPRKPPGRPQQAHGVGRCELPPISSGRTHARRRAEPRAGLVEAMPPGEFVVRSAAATVPSSETYCWPGGRRAPVTASCSVYWSPVPPPAAPRRRSVLTRSASVTPGATATPMDRPCRRSGRSGRLLHREGRRVHPDRGPRPPRPPSARRRRGTGTSDAPSPGVSGGRKPVRHRPLIHRSRLDERSARLPHIEGDRGGAPAGRRPADFGVAVQRSRGSPSTRSYTHTSRSSLAAAKRQQAAAHDIERHLHDASALHHERQTAGDCA